MPSPTDRGALFGLGIYRTVTATWAVVVAVIDARSGVLVRPSLAFAILGPVLAWSLLTALLARRSPEVLLRIGSQVIDIGLGVVVFAAEWLTYDGDHPLRFGAMWQLAPVLGAGLRFGTRGGLAVGVGMGLVNAVALGATEGFEGRMLAAASAVVLMGVAGGAAGAIMDRFRSVEDDLAEARARERVARTLHDGVLQTLAAVQRRSGDAQLVELAARQDRELRRWIRGELAGGAAGVGHGADLVESLHDLAEVIRARDGATIDVVAVSTPEATPEACEALLGAVAEAMTNANKHACASRVTVFLDADGDGLECSVTDDGHGFDAGDAPPGLGIGGSIHGPVEAVGGTAEVRSSPGVGTEVRLRIPLGARGHR